MLLLLIIVTLCTTVYSLHESTPDPCVSKCQVENRKCEETIKEEDKTGAITCQYKLEVCEKKCNGKEPEMTLAEYTCLHTKCLYNDDIQECLAAVNRGEKEIDVCSYQTYSCQRKCQGLKEITMEVYKAAIDLCGPKLRECTKTEKSYHLCIDEYKRCFDGALA